MMKFLPALRALTTAVAAAFLFTGCAPIISGAMNIAATDEVVIEKTAKYFGAAKKEIVVTGIEKGALATAYNTKFRGKFYNCSLYYGEVTCKQPGT